MMADMLFDVRDERVVAVAAPGRAPLGYAGLLQAVERVGDRLASLGIRPGDAVALAAPDGPEALVATLGVSAAAAVAPLNPALTAAECRFLLADLAARAVIVIGDAGAAAVEAARELAIPVLVARPTPGGAAGVFDLDPPAGGPRLPAAGAGRHPSVALLLHTSGTTARPKLVAVGREALALSARAIAQSLALEPGDRCLNVMPLFHVHGLVGAALASLAAGASVCCTGGFNPLRFRRWLDEAGATWYTAVPSMHQAIAARLGHAPRGGDRRTAGRLRLVRSCSSPLPASVRDSLTACFEVPVINAYGMTEAAHQVSSTAVEPGREGASGRAAAPGLGPARDGACSVGFSSGPEIRVLGPGGNWVAPGTPGEIALRGATIIAAYEHPAEANLASFHDGWLRTGDQGIVDSRGEVTLTGRLKELINSSGEKISPYEVEDALLSHPSVAEAVCFAIPSAARGERVGAAVVLAEGAVADERALRHYLAECLAPCKVPERVLALAALPKGPTGKLQRIGLAGRLGL
jgi:acyl-CoA synthetase (AMP-forming)/AMP-acid ligase II